MTPRPPLREASALTPFLIVYSTLGVFLVLLATLVFVARPGHPTNRAFAALLVLEAASEVTYQLMREAPNDGTALMWARLGVWYTIPSLAVTLLLLHHLFPPARPSALRRSGLIVVTSITALGLVAMAAMPSLFVPGVRPSTTLRYADPGPLALAVGVTSYLAWTVAVVLAARAAVSAERSSIGRRQAGLVGLAFVFLLAHASIGRVATLALFPRGFADPISQVMLLPSLLGIAASFWAAPRIASAFDARQRAYAVAALAIPYVGAALDLTLAILRSNGFVPPPWWLSTRIVMVIASSLTLTVALVRFGLAGFGDAMQRRLARVAHVLLLASAVALPAGIVLAFTQGGAAWALAAAIVAASALALSPAPTRSLARGLAGLLLVDPHDPGAMGERARVYATALETHLAPDGTIADADASTLRALRRELDITEREHALLLHGIQRRRGEPTQPLLGRYRVERELGRGAFGAALLATDPLSERKVVLKRFHAGKMERRALSEARALAAVTHPRVLPLLDVQRAGDEIFLVLAYAEGGSLRDALQRDGPMPPARAVALLLDVLDGLAALHRAGLVHRDVKPSNILLDANGRAMLGDFGSARFLSVPELEHTLTGVDVGGSYATIAPEVLRGDPATPAADLYSAGAVLYRLLTGEHYLDLAGRNALQLRQAILMDAPRIDHPLVPATLAPLLASSLAKKPEERPRDADAFKAALEARVERRVPVQLLDLDEAAFRGFVKP